MNSKKVRTLRKIVEGLPVKPSVNHARRIKKMFKQQGKVGIFIYLSPYLKPEARAKVLQSINNLDI